MEDYRSRSYSGGGYGGLQMEVYGGRGGGGGGGDHMPPPPSYDFRSYSTSASAAANNYSSSSSSSWENKKQVAKELKLKKGKSSGSSGGKWMSLSDPELQRKKRVASYKVYAVEGKVKGSFRKSFRWLKDRYTQVLYGWW